MKLLLLQRGAIFYVYFCRILFVSVLGDTVASDTTDEEIGSTQPHEVTSSMETVRRQQTKTKRTESKLIVYLGVSVVGISDTDNKLRHSYVCMSNSCCNHLHLYTCGQNCGHSHTLTILRSKTCHHMMMLSTQVTNYVLYYTITDYKLIN